MSEEKILSVIAGTVWKITSKEGDMIEMDEPIMILESMKMEIPVLAPITGVLRSINVTEGQSIAEDDILAIMGNAP